MKPKTGFLIGILGGIILGIAVTIGVITGFTNVFTSAKLIENYPIDISTLISHSHSKVDVSDGQAAPTLKIEARADSMKPGNYSLHIFSANFIFKPESTSSVLKFGEGHAHVYVDHVLIGRAYSEWFHIPRLKAGKHKIYVTLNHNDHKEYSIAGKTIDAEIEIEVK
jgi:hypothetical protein